MSSLLGSLRFMAKSSGSRLIVGPSNIYDPCHQGGYKMPRNISLFVFFPIIGLLMANCYITHASEEHVRPDFIPYEHLRKRTKRFAWGDGDKSLFHNTYRNALPDGYEGEE